jgi:prepilin-type N-terminal cleavage/methylation domain-containing protein
MQEQEKSQHGLLEGGFTLIELLIAIVVVGVLTAVAIVGIGGLVDNGHTAACQATLDASKAASAVYFANTGGYPQSFTVLSNTSVLEVPAGVTPAATTLKGKGWTLTMTANGATAPSDLACS